MTREEILDEIYDTLSEALEDSELNPDGASILSYVPSYEFSEFPLIVLNQFNYSLDKETLSKTEKKHSISIEAQIFSIDTATDNRRKVGNRLADLVEGVIQDEYGFTLNMSSVIPNLNENIHRIMLRFTGLVDDDTKIIYRET